MMFRPLTLRDGPLGNAILSDVFIGERYVPASFANRLTIESNAASGTWVGAFSSEDHLVGLVLLTEFGLKAARTAQLGEAEIRLLAVSASQRRSNVATGLVNAAEGLASQKGHTKLSLSTQEVMVAAQELYRRLGYEELPERGYESLGKRFLVFGKSLGMAFTRDHR